MNEWVESGNDWGKDSQTDSCQHCTDWNVFSCTANCLSELTLPSNKAIWNENEKIHSTLKTNMSFWCKANGKYFPDISFIFHFKLAVLILMDRDHDVHEWPDTWDMIHSDKPRQASKKVVINKWSEHPWRPQPTLE